MTDPITPEAAASVLTTSRVHVSDYLDACWPLTYQESKHGQLDATRIHSAFTNPDDDVAQELSLYDLARLVDPTLGLAKECPECGADAAELAWGCANTVTGAAGHGQLRASDVQAVVYLGCLLCSATLATIDLEQFLPMVVPVLP